MTSNSVIAGLTGNLDATTTVPPPGLAPKSTPIFVIAGLTRNLDASATVPLPGLVPKSCAKEIRPLDTIGSINRFVIPVLTRNLDASATVQPPGLVPKSCVKEIRPLDTRPLDTALDTLFHPAKKAGHHA